MRATKDNKGYFFSTRKGTVILDPVWIGERFQIYRGWWGNMRLVAKVAKVDEYDNLENEYRMYMKLSRLQGDYIPRCFGLFVVEGGLMLLLEDCGKSVGSFSELDGNAR
jgi:hypothetical protein